MSNIYRVRYKKGDVELDIESSDKEYVDRKLEEFWSTGAAETQNKTKRSRANRNHVKTKAAEEVHAPESSAKVPDSTLASIIASINDAENYEDIAKHVLDKADRTPRILMCYYFARKHPTDPALTTTDVDQITAQLGVKIAQPNVAKVIRERAGKYLTADRVRKRGFATHYKINRRGIATFEKIASGKTPET